MLTNFKIKSYKILVQEETRIVLEKLKLRETVITKTSIQFFLFLLFFSVTDQYCYHNPYSPTFNI